MSKKDNRTKYSSSEQIVTRSGRDRDQKRGKDKFRTDRRNSEKYNNY